MIKRRVKALKNLQMQAKQVEGKFFEDLNNIENRYRVNRLNPIYDSRMRIVQGDLEESQGVPENCGVPLFWLHAMLNCDTLKPIIQEHDLPILKYLSDIRVVSSHKSSIKNSNSAKSSSSHSFSLEFHFMPNEFFQDRVLVKDYEVSCCPDPEDLIAFGGPEIVNCKGCKINWNKGRNATLRPVKKLAKSTGQVVQKWAKRNSFFNFFNPPRLTGKEALTDIKKTMLLEAHFEIGLHFKETFVPKAIIFFLSEEAIGQSNVSGVRRGSLDATAVVAGKKKVSAAGAGSIHGGKLGNKKKSGGVAGNGGRNVTAAMIGGDSSADQSTPSVFSNSNLSVVR